MIQHNYIIAESRAVERLERLRGALLVALLLGAVIAFGGHVWWWWLASAALAASLVACAVVLALLRRRLRFLASPLSLVGVCALALAFAQLVPLPAALLNALSRRSALAYAMGDPSAPTDASAVALGGRAPISVDRPATLRWLVQSTIAFVVFVTCAHFADRRSRSNLVHGSIAAAFMFAAFVSVIQIQCEASGLLGVLKIGNGPAWAPSVDMVRRAPEIVTLRLLTNTDHADTVRAVSRLGRPMPLALFIGGPDAILALGALALPITLGLVLARLVPTSIRETPWGRLRQKGETAAFLTLGGGVILGAGLVGYLGGVWLSIPVALSLVIVGVGSIIGTKLRSIALVLTLCSLSAIGVGAALTAGAREPSPSTPMPLARQLGIDGVRNAWFDTLRIARDFRLAGSGMGTFAVVYPYYKSADESLTSCSSSWLRWMSETGGAGLLLGLLAVAWCARSAGRALGRLRAGDRVLALGLLASLGAFGALSLVHDTLELPAACLFAAALLGLCNRWMAGATDLFTERG